MNDERTVPPRKRRQSRMGSALIISIHGERWMGLDFHRWHPRTRTAAPTPRRWMHRPRSTAHSFAAHAQIRRVLADPDHERKLMAFVEEIRTKRRAGAAPSSEENPDA